jgi:hypothetical protein
VTDAVLRDFRVVDRVLAETDSDAADVVYAGPKGAVAFPFVVWRSLSGPGGVYIDACEIVDPEGRVIRRRTRRGRAVDEIERVIVATWEKRFELEGESVHQDIVDEVRTLRFPRAGQFLLRYSLYDEHIIDVPFQVLAQDPPWGVVPGPLDAALSKSTIAWLRVPQPNGESITKPIWYGYQDGRIYVLVGPGEQDIPGLGEASAVTILARSKDKQSLVAEHDCLAWVMDKDASWDRVAKDLLIGRRLNLPDGEKAMDRWKRECEIVVLAPIPPPRQ